jgi:oxygen-independent coproporphyrinogen-3 oxidase
MLPDTKAHGPNPEMGVYVHFPWCLAKCPYCDFLSVAVESPVPGRPPNAVEARAVLPHEAYADAVLGELGARFARLARPLPRLRSVFFGGGTPSLWQAAALGRVLEGILKVFGAPSRPSVEELEITVECNPTSLDTRQIEALLAVGVNRISVGVQSLSAERLHFLGRLHDENDGLRAVRAALAAGVPRVSADLIYGVYDQGPEQAVREVEAVAATGVTHLSAYALTIERNTKFGAMEKAGRLPLLDDSLVASSFDAVSTALDRVGLKHYEISNFARPGHESRHNRGYWLGDDYLGLGTGAFGTVSLTGAAHRLRYKNLLVPERYTAAFSGPQPSSPFDAPLAERELIDGATSVQEALLLGLRLREGVDLGELARRHGVDPWPKERLRAARRLEAIGRLEIHGDRLSIPSRAWLFADGIIRDLL